MFLVLLPLTSTQVHSTRRPISPWPRSCLLCAETLLASGDTLRPGTGCSSPMGSLCLLALRVPKGRSHGHGDQQGERLERIPPAKNLRAHSPALPREASPRKPRPDTAVVGWRQSRSISSFSGDRGSRVYDDSNYLPACSLCSPFASCSSRLQSGDQLP